ncbi:MAG: hypothetical protein J6S74_03105 [Alphaproteobacteria bacterium]|nr:hypothetical protein [Alphaproteobacteria bacterium]
MNEDEKMYNIGIWAIGIAIVMTVVLQVCYRTQNRVLKRVHADILATNRQIAIDETKFAEFVLPTSLRDRVTTIVPHAETIGFHKNVTINELANRK